MSSGHQYKLSLLLPALKQYGGQLPSVIGQLCSSALHPLEPAHQKITDYLESK